jgi:hypothetical protein
MVFNLASLKLPTYHPEDIDPCDREAVGLERSLLGAINSASSNINSPKFYFLCFSVRAILSKLFKDKNNLKNMKQKTHIKGIIIQKFHPLERVIF